MRGRRYLILGPDNNPVWVRLYVHKIDEKWAALIAVDDMLPPERGGAQRTGLLWGDPRRSGAGGEGLPGGAQRRRIDWAWPLAV